MNLLETGTRTKVEMRKLFTQVYPDSVEKSTFDVFFSDLIRPFGRASASRELSILEEQRGVLRLDPKQAERTKKAVASGLLDEIHSIQRGLFPKTDTAAIAAILRRYGMR